MHTADIERALDYSFRDPSLLAEALTHRSFGIPHNERLEFLGDSVLNCVVAAALHERFPDLREGELSRQRAALVRQDTLAGLAVGIDLGRHLRLGEGELRSGGAHRPSMLADALEAVFGAIFLDRGFEAAREVIVRLYAGSFAAIDPRRDAKDAKTALQEWLQARRHGLPEYEVAATRGQAHAQEFEVVCQVRALGVSAVGIGPSRRAAEQQAAMKALERLSRT